MKKIFLLLVVFSSLSFSAKALDASVTYATFKSPDQPYIEVYLHVLGQSLVQKMTEDSMFYSKVAVFILFKQEEKIVKFDKFMLNSPLENDTIDIYDLKRYGLENGAYDLEISVTDAHNETNKRVYKTKIEVNYNDEGLMQSDVELLGTIKADQSDNPAVKNGYYMEALPFNFYHKNITELIFYNEVYNADKAIGDDYLVRYYIEKVNGNGSTETMIIGNKKRKPEPTTVLLYKLDISRLPSANYNLVVEIRNRGGELLGDKKIFFQRSNPYLDLEVARTAPLEDKFVAKLTQEELRYSLKAIAPLVRDAEVNVLNYLIANKDSLDSQRRYLFTFWAIENPNSPDIAYEKYMEVARAVDRTYKSGFGYGFETDRGYTFIKYGKPNDVRKVDNDPSAPPYEMWVYENFPRTNQNRVKFIFFNPSLSPGDFRFLHSTARGEINNPQWELELYREVPNEIEGNDFISGTQMQGNINRQARRLFEDL
ncbi:MAG: GWxTD domain-containing protein [Saprospiraceae bacterium]|jgi:GWxTD domain-containing protein